MGHCGPTIQLSILKTTKGNNFWNNRTKTTNLLKSLLLTSQRHCTVQSCSREKMGVWQELGTSSVLIRVNTNDSKFTHEELSKMHYMFLFTCGANSRSSVVFCRSVQRSIVGANAQRRFKQQALPTYQGNKQDLYASICSEDYYFMPKVPPTGHQKLSSAPQSQQPARTSSSSFLSCQVHTNESMIMTISNFLMTIFCKKKKMVGSGSELLIRIHEINSDLNQSGSTRLHQPILKNIKNTGIRFLEMFLVRTKRSLISLFAFQDYCKYPHF